MEKLDGIVVSKGVGEQCIRIGRGDSRSGRVLELRQVVEQDLIYIVDTYSRYI